MTNRTDFQAPREALRSPAYWREVERIHETAGPKILSSSWAQIEAGSSYRARRHAASCRDVARRFLHSDEAVEIVHDDVCGRGTLEAVVASWMHDFPVATGARASTLAADVHRRDEWNGGHKPNGEQRRQWVTPARAETYDFAYRVAIAQARQARVEAERAEDRKRRLEGLRSRGYIGDDGAVTAAGDHFMFEQQGGPDAELLLAVREGRVSAA